MEAVILPIFNLKSGRLSLKGSINVSIFSPCEYTLKKEALPYQLSKSSLFELFSKKILAWFSFFKIIGCKNDNTLDAVIIKTIREQAKNKNYSFSK